MMKKSLLLKLKKRQQRQVKEVTHKVAEKEIPERRCIVEGEVKPVTDLIRFAVSPQGDIVPDLDATLPGRGLWVTSRREAVDEAVKKRRFAKAAKAKVRAEAGLADLVEARLRVKCLDLLGLARRSGNLISGFEKVKATLATGEAVVLLAAADGAADGREKLSRLARDLPVVTLFGVADLSLALGRENIVHASLSSGGLADRFLKETRRLAGFCDDLENDPGIQEPEK
jgi:uncharacterized protein